MTISVFPAVIFIEKRIGHAAVDPGKTFISQRKLAAASYAAVHGKLLDGKILTRLGPDLYRCTFLKCQADPFHIVPAPERRQICKIAAFCSPPIRWGENLK